MQEAVPEGEGAMAAIIGLDYKSIEQICLEELKGEMVSPANYNAQDQVVISGLKQAVERASELAKKHGAKRVIPLKVSAPFHCELMKPAEIKLKNDIEKVVFRDARYPVFSNVEAKMTVRSSELKENLIKQVTAPVKWYQIINAMVENGVSEFVEIGPGKVLTGLIKRISPNSKVYNIQDKKSLEEVFDALV
jgi:[acyl-carrier-protein] S-malonyltransferase